MDGAQNLQPHIHGQFMQNPEQMQMQKDSLTSSNSCESSFRSKSRDEYKASDVNLSSPRHGDEENPAHAGGAKIRYYLPCLCTLVYGMLVVAIWLSASIARDKQQNAKQLQQQRLGGRGNAGAEGEPQPTSATPTRPSPLASSSGTHASANPQWYTTSHPDYQTILLNSPNDNASDPVQMAHLHARDFCLARSMTLCTYRRYCPDGPSSPPYDDENESGTNRADRVPSTIFDRNPSEWEQWAPLASSGEMHDVGNGWVQVGRVGEEGVDDHGGGRCWIYEDWIGDVDGSGVEVPDLGVGNLRWILCCPVEEEESASRSGNNSGGSNSGSGSSNEVTGDSGGV